MSFTKSSLNRIESSATVQQLYEGLLIAFPKAILESARGDIEGFLRIEGAATDKRSHVFWDASQGLLYAALFEENEHDPKLTVSLKPVKPPHALDMKFANAYVRVFNEDVRATPLLLRHQELWETLALSRLPRTIARLTAFSTMPFLSWLTAMEAATHLRYEGAPFRPVVLMSKQHEWISEPAGDGYVAFKSPIGFARALLEEKWIRAISESSHVGLHGLGHSGDIVGVVSLRFDAGTSMAEVVLPTELQPIASLVRPGTMAFVSASNGDLYVVLPSGAVFVKSQGRWQYQNFAAFQTLLAEYVSPEFAKPILRLMLDLSYSRSGALFSIPANSSEVDELVPDHKHSQRANLALRASVTGLSIHSPEHRRILLAAAAVDGALVISSSGTVLDVACMIGDPGEAALQRAGYSQLSRFPGARSTAAWNSSIFGLGIKVSEDGPISVFSSGQLVGQFG